MNGLTNVVIALIIGALLLSAVAPALCALINEAAAPLAMLIGLSVVARLVWFYTSDRW